MKKLSFPVIAVLAMVTAVFSVPLSGCSGKKDDLYVERPAEALYNEALSLMNDGKFRDASKAFDEVERQHPYSTWAMKAQVMGAYALYENSDYDDANVALSRFIDLHPGNKDIAYAYYLRALCQYEQMSDVRRDQSATERAAEALTEVMRRFPESEYARDARLKLDLTRDHLAGREMVVGRYYLKSNQYLAAMNRFRKVIEKFDQTTHVPEALYRLVEINTILGLNWEAQRVAAILGHNFPGSEWYQDAYDLVGEVVLDENAPPPPVSSALTPVESQTLP